MMFLRHSILAGSLLLLGRTTLAEPVDYIRQVKPLLQKYCYECHGAKEQESGLRLDNIPLTIRGGARGPSVTRGKAAASLLIQAVNGTHKELKMPPEKPRLSAAEIKLLADWIDQGAKGPHEEIVASDDHRRKHWAWQPVRRPALPNVNSLAWCQTPIDRFVLSRLEQASIEPSLDADRITLIRRLSLDLLGLPPSVEDVERFLADREPGAYERLVDRLLSSPHYGERWGRHWLDIARYGDSNGFTIDSARSIWPYRDWVINALNNNMPFDQFVIEQMAGDMLPDATQDQIIATGLHRNTLRNEEGGTDQEQFRVEAIVDRVNTTGTVLLGLTIGCAQCHDHKYDPISQRDYYQLYAFLNNADEPQLELSTAAQKQQQTELAKQLVQADKQLTDFDAKAQPAWESQLASSTADVTWTVLDPQEYTSSAGAKINELDDHSLLVSGGEAKHDTYTVVADAPESGVTAVRLETLTHDNLPSKGPGLAANGNFVLAKFAVFVDAGKDESGAGLRPAKWSKATADFSQDAFKIAGTIDDDPKTGWGIYGGTSANHVATFEAQQAIDAPAGTRFVIKLAHTAYSPSYKIGRFRISVTTSPVAGLSVADDVRKALRTPADKRTKQQLTTLTNAYRSSTKERQPLQAQVDKLKKSQAALKKSISSTLVMRERSSPRETFIQIRGDFLRKGQRVYPDVPEIFCGAGLKLSDEARNRLDLARWFFDPSHPLTARVTVNRIWQRFFGVGLVETENDFGVRGSPPTHPELLDWLASEFVRSNWDVKALHRLIVTSTTYRLSSHARPDLIESDPTNKLLSRQRRLRLEAESVRDVALAASGLLAHKIGGPSVFPPQPKGLDLFTQTRKNWKDSQGASRFRRGMYTYFWRSNPHPFLMTFDAPDGNATCTRRVRSNTPLQALTLANDITFVELAQALATRTLMDVPGDTHARIDYLFGRSLGRKPNDVERNVVLRFLDEQQDAYAASPKDAEEFAPKVRPKGMSDSDAAAWTAVARLLLNLDEFITRE